MILYSSVLVRLVRHAKERFRLSTDNATTQQAAFRHIPCSSSPQETEEVIESFIHNTLGH